MIRHPPIWLELTNDLKAFATGLKRFPRNMTRKVAMEQSQNVRRLVLH